MTRSSPDNAALCQSVARKVLSSMRRARQPDTYGSSYANSMNEDISREVAEDIVASFQPAHSSAGRASAAEVEVHVHDLIAEALGQEGVTYSGVRRAARDIIKTFSINGVAQPAPDCSCARAGFPNSCYNCDVESADIVNALRKLYGSHPICQQAANFIERSASAAQGPTEPLQCLRCGTVDAFGPVSKKRAQATPDLAEVTRLLTKISDLVDDEDAGEPLDDAIGYANKALAALAPMTSTEPTQTAPEQVMDLPLIWQGWCNAIRLMEDKATVRRPESAAQAAAYEQCAKELKAALALSSTEAPAQPAIDQDREAVNRKLRATIEECAKIAENNGWEATAAQIRGLALPSTIRRGPCQVCGETADLKYGPSRFGPETWACTDCWNPDGVSMTSPRPDRCDMMGDLEISDLLDGVSREQMDAALAAINGYGFDISAPWQCDQDDREYDQFCGLLNAVRAALALSRPQRDTP